MSFDGPSCDADLQILRQYVFDALGEPGPTPDGSMGFQDQCSVTVPFTSCSFEKHFRHLPGIPPTGNVKRSDVSTDLVIPVLGEDCTWRPSPYSSSAMMVNHRFKIRISWGCKERVKYDHSQCPRCSWTADKGPTRPSECKSTGQVWPSVPTLTLTFHKQKVNTIAGKY